MVENNTINTRDFHAGNGVLLPSGPGLAEALRLPLHNGPHPWLATLQLGAFEQADLERAFSESLAGNIGRGMLFAEAERAAAVEVRGLVLGMQDIARLGVSPRFDADGRFVDIDGKSYSILQAQERGLYTPASSKDAIFEAD